MIRLVRRIFNGRVDVLSFEKRVVGQHFFETGAVGQKLQNIAHADSLPSNARAAPTLAVFNSDSPESVSAHREFTPLNDTLRPLGPATAGPKAAGTGDAQATRIC